MGRDVLWSRAKNARREEEGKKKKKKKSAMAQEWRKGSENRAEGVVLCGRDYKIFKKFVNAVGRRVGEKGFACRNDHGKHGGREKRRKRPARAELQQTRVAPAGWVALGSLSRVRVLTNRLVFFLFS